MSFYNHINVTYKYFIILCTNIYKNKVILRLYININIIAYIVIELNKKYLFILLYVYVTFSSIPYIKLTYLYIYYRCIQCS